MTKNVTNRQYKGYTIAHEYGYWKVYDKKGKFLHHFYTLNIARAYIDRLPKETS